MNIKPRLKYCDHFGRPRRLDYSELLELQAEVDAEAAAPAPPMIMKSATGSPSINRLADAVVDAVRTFVARKIGDLDARVSMLEEQRNDGED